MEAEAFLQAEYAKFYVEPFVILTITNKRVIVFPGTGSSASVVSLSNNNTTLIEVLALVGGIATNSKASRIKIVRKTKVKKDVYLVDLSTIEGIQAGSMIVQANDIIYVEPNPNLATRSISRYHSGCIFIFQCTYWFGQPFQILKIRHDIRRHTETERNIRKI